MGNSSSTDKATTKTPDAEQILSPPPPPTLEELATAESWRPRCQTCEDATNRVVMIAIPKGRVPSIVALLSHYPDLIVYMGYSLWRKMLIHVPSSYFDTEKPYSPYRLSLKTSESQDTLLYPQTKRIVGAGALASAVAGSLEWLTSSDWGFGKPEPVMGMLRFYYQIELTNFLHATLLLDQRDCVAVFLSSPFREKTNLEDQGRSALHLAAAMTPSLPGTTPYFSVYTSSASASLKLLKDLLRIEQEDGGFDVDEINDLDHPEGGRTSLHVAVRNDNLMAVKTLVENGADPLKTCPVRRQTSLHLAAVHLANTRILEYLLSRPNVLEGIDNEDRDGRSPLNAAAYSNSDRGVAAIATLLLEKGADRESKDNYILTPLQNAGGTGNVNILSVLETIRNH